MYLCTLALHFELIKEMKKLYIETYGCQMNVADSEVVASIMQMAGYEPTDNEEDADAVFLNTCSVRENAENKIYHRLDQLFAKKNHNARLKRHGSDSNGAEAENKGVPESGQKDSKGSARPFLGVLGCMAERVKDDLKEVAQGYECGIGLEKFNDIKVGDVLESFIMEEIPR